MDKGKIAILVPNPCNPDYRVIRQAETLVAAGYEVRLYATKNAQTPPYEQFNGVQYIRSSWNLIRDFSLWITGAFRLDSHLKPVRDQNSALLEKAKRKSLRPTAPDTTRDGSPRPGERAD